MQNYRRFRQMNQHTSETSHIMESFRLWEAIEELNSTDTFLDDILKGRLINLFQDALAGWTWEDWEAAGSSEKESIVTYATANIGQPVDTQTVYDLFWEWVNGLEPDAFTESMAESTSLQELKRYDPNSTIFDTANLDTSDPSSFINILDEYCMSQLSAIPQKVSVVEDVDLFAAYDGYWSDKKTWQSTVNRVIAFPKDPATQCDKIKQTLESDFKQLEVSLQDLARKAKTKYTTLVSDLTISVEFSEFEDYEYEEYEEDLPEDSVAFATRVYYTFEHK